MAGAGEEPGFYYELDKSDSQYIKNYLRDLKKKGQKKGIGRKG